MNGLRFLRRFLGPSQFTTEGESALVGYSLDIVKDAFIERVRLGLLAGLPQNSADGQSVAPDDALAAMGHDRRLIRGRTESSVDYAARLLPWIEVHKTRGNPYALMDQLAAYTGPGPFFRTVDNKGNWYTRAADGTRSVHLAGGNWNWDGDSSQWARFWVIIYPESLWDFGHTYDDGVVWGSAGGDVGPVWGASMSPNDVNTIRAIIADWKPAGTSCVHIILSPDIDFDPTLSFGHPDGTWGNASKVSGGVRVPSRLGAGRYIPGGTTLGHTYTGNPAQRPTTVVQLPDDTESITGASAQVPFEAWIDYAAWFNQKFQDAALRNWPHAGPGTLSGVTLTGIVDIAYVGGTYGSTWVMTEQDNTGYNTWQSSDHGATWTQLGSMHAVTFGPSTCLASEGDAGTFGAAGKLVIGFDNSGGVAGNSIAKWNGSSWAAELPVLGLDIGGGLSSSQLQVGGVRYFAGLWVACGRIFDTSYGTGGTFRGEGYSMWSADHGATWTKGAGFRPVPGSIRGTDYDGAFQWTLLDNGTLLVAMHVVNGSSSALASNKYAITTDGKTWTVHTGPWTNEPAAFAYDTLSATFLVLDASGFIWSSADGVNWSKVTMVAAPVGTPTGFASVNGTWAVSGSLGLAYSLNKGVTWAISNGPVSATVKSSSDGFLAFTATATKANIRGLY